MASQRGPGITQSVEALDSLDGSAALQVCCNLPQTSLLASTVLAYNLMQQVRMAQLWAGLHIQAGGSHLRIFLLLRMSSLLLSDDCFL